VNGDGTEERRLIAGRYRLERRIGGGAMGVVYVARDEVLGRTVAVKELLLSPAFSKTEAEHARRRSFREARIAARLQHRHAITVFNVVTDDGKPVLVMEYLPSQSLAEVLHERGSISPEEAARIGADAASGLTAAHAAGIIHRDVKPGNILIGDGGIAKITDFGISRATDDGTLTGSGRFAGTPAFLSPEAARGEPPSQASDVFSLGATLYTAVEGRFPYGESENQMAMLYAAAAGRYTPPKQAGPLADVLARMMLLDPAARPTMAQLEQELRTLTSPAPAPRKRRGLVYAGLGLAAAAATITFVLWPGQPKTNAAPPASASLGASPPASDSVPPSSAPSSSAPKSSAPTSTTSLVDAVREYYTTIVPGNLDLGWSRLGPDLQGQNGKASYVSWWSAFSNLHIVSGPTLVTQNTVDVTLDFDRKGTHYRETHQLGMIVRDGQPLINTDTLIPATY